MAMLLLFAFRARRKPRSTWWARCYESLRTWVFERHAPVPTDAEIRRRDEERGEHDRDLHPMDRERRAELLHRLKTPLLGIRQLSELLPRTESLSADGQRKVEILRRAAAEALGTVDDLLVPPPAKLARRTDETVDLGELVREVVARLRPHAEYKWQTVHLAIPAAACRVEGDPIGLREAVENLVGNALKYSPVGTRVAVRVGRADGVVQFTVSDEGPGLSLTDQERLFKRFQRLQPRPTGGEASSGLGLYLTKQVVEAHGGAIGVVTAPGKGSTFGVVLPEASGRRGPAENE